MYSQMNLYRSVSYRKHAGRLPSSYTETVLVYRNAFVFKHILAESDPGLSLEE